MDKQHPSNWHSYAMPKTKNFYLTCVNLLGHKSRNNMEHYLKKINALLENKNTHPECQTIVVA
jgi:hypothetical protein